MRKATPDDAVALRDCMAAAYAGYVDRMGGKRLPPMDLDYHIEIRDYPTWVAEQQGRIAGGLTMMFESGHASIANIGLHPEFQGQGMGAGMMGFAQQQARQRGFTELRLATHVLLTENLGLYRHLGWIEYDRDDVRVYLKKELNLLE